MKPLLIMAHRAEAKSFIHKDDLRSIKSFEGKLYEGEKYLLLICGEGILESLQWSSSVISTLNERVDKVINLGIAGSLSKHINKNEIICPRSIYSYNDSKLAFNSFQNNSNDSYDLITTSSRVLDDSERNKLSKFASIVDREAWAIAYACQNLKKNFEVYKMISDEVGDEEICQRVKEQSEFYSNTLYEYFHTNLVQTNEEIRRDPSTNFNIPKGFHFSLSQKRLFLNMCETSQEYPQNIINDVLRDFSHKREKERTKILLERLHDKINPFMAKIRSTLNDLSIDFQNDQYKIIFDKNLESSSFWLNAKINNEDDLNAFKERLLKLPYTKIVNTLEGQIDV